MTNILLLKSVWERWKIVAKKIGDFQARLILSVLYFIVIGPFALIVRWGADPLSLKKGKRRGWLLKPIVEGPHIKRAMNQF